MFLFLTVQREFEEAEKILRGEDAIENGNELCPEVCYVQGGVTAMHMAAINDDAEGVRLLLRYGVDKDFKDEKGYTALDFAKRHNARAIVALLS